KRLTNRKQRLFACGACRHAFGHVLNLFDVTRSVVEVEELAAEGVLDESAVRKAHDANYSMSLAWGEAETLKEVAATMRIVGEIIGHCFPADDYRYAADRAISALPGQATLLCHLLRDVAGNPFASRSPSMGPWEMLNDGAVTKIARSIYDE